MWVKTEHNILHRASKFTIIRLLGDGKITLGYINTNGGEVLLDVPYTSDNREALQLPEDYVVQT